MGVHGGGTSVAPSQLRTPTQPETLVMDCGRILTPTAIGRAPVVFSGRPSTLRVSPSCTPKAYPYARSVRSSPFIGPPSAISSMERVSPCVEADPAGTPEFVELPGQAELA